MLDRRLSDLISALREAALDLPPGRELTAVLEQLRKATDEENQRVWNRLQQGLPDRRYVANRPSTINSKLATIMAAFRRV
jgi:predicted ATPase